MNLEARADELVLIALKRIASVHGLSAKIYRRLGLYSCRGGRACSVAKHWPTGIPMAHVFVVSAVTKIPPEQLRPDVFLRDPLRREAAIRYCRVGPPPVKEKQPRRPGRAGVLIWTEAHRAMWLDRESYRTNDDAAAALAAAQSFPVSAWWLRKRFGPSGRSPGEFGRTHPAPRGRPEQQRAAALANRSNTDNISNP